MWTAIATAAAGICALGWFFNHVSAKAIIHYYVTVKGYTPPSGEETRACTRYVIRKMFSGKP